MSILLEKGLIILFGHKSCGFLTNNTKKPCHKWVALENTQTKGESMMLFRNIFFNLKF